MTESSHWLSAHKYSRTPYLIGFPLLSRIPGRPDPGLQERLSQDAINNDFLRLFLASQLRIFPRKKGSAGGFAEKEHNLAICKNVADILVSENLANLGLKPERYQDDLISMIHTYRTRSCSLSWPSIRHISWLGSGEC